MVSNCRPSTQLLSPSSATIPWRTPTRHAHDLEGMKEQRHRPAHGKRNQDERGRDQKRDLRAAADGDLQGERHLVRPRGGDGAVVLGGVADDGNDDHAGEQLGEPERGSVGSNALTRISA